MAMNAEYKSSFEALNRKWWCLHMSKKFSSGTKTPKQTENYLDLSWPEIEPRSPEYDANALPLRHRCGLPAHKNH